jgi:hypothetical protein
MPARKRTGEPAERGERVCTAGAAAEAPSGSAHRSSEAPLAQCPAGYSPARREFTSSGSAAAHPGPFVAKALAMARRDPINVLDLAPGSGRTRDVGNWRPVRKMWTGWWEARR